MAAASPPQPLPPPLLALAADKMLPVTVVRTEAVIEILSFGVGGIIAIVASVKETEIWASTCTPLNPDGTCPPETTCPPEGAACPSLDPSSWDEGRLEGVFECIRCVSQSPVALSSPARSPCFTKRE